MMSSKNSDDLAQRVAQLEKQVAGLRRTGCRVTVRRRSELTLFGLPLWDIAGGPDAERGELMGHARGIIAIGDEALGVVAIGGLARGLFALGGLALGVFSLGGCSIGLILALGGLAIGGVAAGGAAVGAIALGGAALGYLAIGGGGFGKYVIAGNERSPEAMDFLQQLLDWF